jgi:hypothetical protein
MRKRQLTNQPSLRGTVNTIPFQCYDNEFETFNMLKEQSHANSSDTTIGRLWARAEIDAAACLKRGNSTGQFLGTAFVARDLISVVDALGEDGMLRYWGTYSTLPCLLGDVFAFFGGFFFSH